MIDFGNYTEDETAEIVSDGLCMLTDERAMQVIMSFLHENVLIDEMVERLNIATDGNEEET